MTSHPRYRPFDRSDAAPGRVLRADRGVCTVLDATGVTRASLAGSVLLGAARDPALLPCAGDWVVLRRWPDRRTTIECVLPRRTTLIRRTADKDSTGQVLAANMDTVAVVEPMLPGARRRPRSSACSRWPGNPARNRCSCFQERHRRATRQAVARQLAELAPGVPVLPVSVQRGDGLDELRRAGRARPHAGAARPFRRRQVHAGQRAGRRRR